MRTVLLAAILLASGLLAQAPVKDRDLGLSRTSVFEVPAPPAWKDEASAPGDRKALPRPHKEFPPQISHGVGDFLPITRTSNMCVDCHAVKGPRKKGEAIPLPASHYVDLRAEPPAKGSKVNGARWVCTACHVALTDAPPLVANRFKR